MKKSSTSVAELKNIINPTGMSMTDKERLDLIERVYREMRHYRTLVNYYTERTCASPTCGPGRRARPSRS